jgi:hypothetical protein
MIALVILNSATHLQLKKVKPEVGSIQYPLALLNTKASQLKIIPQPEIDIITSKFSFGDSELGVIRSEVPVC